MRPRAPPASEHEPPIKEKRKHDARTSDCGRRLRAKPAGDRAAGSTAKATVAATGRGPTTLNQTDSYCKMAAHPSAATQSVYEAPFVFPTCRTSPLVELYVGGKARSAST